MDEKRLGRRRLLSGGLALASGRLSSRAAMAAPQIVTGTACALVDRKAAEEAACHAPFRAAFLAWLGEVSGRCALPVSVDTAATSHTILHVPGRHPALEIRLDGDMDINVYATWKGVFWDIVASMDVDAELAPDGSGWRSEALVPEAQHLHPTREACWREDGFEWLLRWLNDELAPATHLALYGGDGCYEGEGWTSAHLVRGGILLHTGKPAADNGPLRELLPLHTARA